MENLSEVSGGRMELRSYMSSTNKNLHGSLHMHGISCQFKMGEGILLKFWNLLEFSSAAVSKYLCAFFLFKLKFYAAGGLCTVGSPWWLSSIRPSEFHDLDIHSNFHSSSCVELALNSYGNSQPADNVRLSPFTAVLALFFIRISSNYTTSLAALCEKAFSFCG